MQLNITSSEEKLIKEALNQLTGNLDGVGDKYNTIADILNKINNAGLVKSERTPKVFVRKQYMFSFEEGGFNTVWAKTLPGAKRQALFDYKDYDLTIRLDSVHLVTKKGLDSAMSLFH